MTEWVTKAFRDYSKKIFFHLFSLKENPQKNVFFLVKDSLPDFGLRTIKGPDVPKCPS